MYGIYILFGVIPLPILFYPFLLLLPEGLSAKGFSKVDNFRSGKNKQVYAYLLTLTDVEEKARITVRFL